MQRIIRRLVEAVVFQLVIIGVGYFGFDIGFDQAKEIVGDLARGDTVAAMAVVDERAPALSGAIAWARAHLPAGAPGGREGPADDPAGGESVVAGAVGAVESAAASLVDAGVDAVRSAYEAIGLHVAEAPQWPMAPGARAPFAPYPAAACQARYCPLPPQAPPAATSPTTTPQLPIPK
jgi:hypothetical protein